jgi:hypothetical protein
MQFDPTLSFTLADGTVITGADLDISFMDRPTHKFVIARIHAALDPFVLWQGAAYDTIGDWTQAQAETRILELLNAQRS